MNDPLNKLTEDQVDLITKTLDEVVDSNPSLKMISNLPSNNGVEYSSEDQKGEYKKVMISVDPNTGENRIAGPINEEKFEKEFDELINNINSNISTEMNVSITSVSGNIIEDELREIVNKDFDFSEDTIKELVVITNKFANKEKINIYRSLPEEMKVFVDDYVSKSGLYSMKDKNRLANEVSEAMISKFIEDIKMKRSANDFALGLSKLQEYSKCDDESYSNRDILERIESDSKKEEINMILDKIEDATDLDSLKEFSKKCKIKKIEIEMPYRRVYSDFLNKYRNSENNIYDIALAHKALSRALKSELGASLFLICFCKQVKNYKSENPLDHAYMYYLIYNCTLLDTELKSSFLDNVNEVISNVKVRNNFK
jgi:hypothetical protein